MVDKGRAAPSLIPEDLQVVSCDVDINHFAFLKGKSGRFEFLAEPTNSWICSPSPLPLCQRLKPSPYAQQSFWWGARNASASDDGEAYVGGWLNNSAHLQKNQVYGGFTTKQGT